MNSEIARIESWYFGRHKYVEMVNKSYSKYFSQNSVIPKLIPRYANKKDKILDFGAGKDAFGVRYLRALGYDVTGYDVGDNFNPEYHDADALKRKYDVIYASNVMNIQPTIPDILAVLGALYERLKKSKYKNKFVIINYPEKPNYSGLSPKLFVKNQLSFMFRKENIEHIKDNVWLCRKAC